MNSILYRYIRRCDVSIFPHLSPLTRCCYIDRKTSHNSLYICSLPSITDQMMLQQRNQTNIILVMTTSLNYSSQETIPLSPIYIICTQLSYYYYYIPFRYNIMIYAYIIFVLSAPSNQIIFFQTNYYIVVVSVCVLHVHHQHFRT